MSRKSRLPAASDQAPLNAAEVRLVQVDESPRFTNPHEHHYLKSLKPAPTTLRGRPMPKDNGWLCW
jgi:hypothetical protein